MDVRITASYMVKNEAEYLPFSLQSIHAAVDEIIVVDNGSTDATVAIARSFPKVKLFSSDARDFSALRNLTLDLASGEWVMIMCADEVFYDDVNEVLPRLVQDPAVDAYTCWYFHLMRSFYYMQNRYDCDPQYQRVLLFRNRPSTRYVKPVHQYLAGLGENIRDSGLHYVHYGYVKDPDQILARWQLYAELEGTPGAFDHLEPDGLLADRPLYPFTREHPPAIRDYVEAKAAELASQGHKLYRRPPRCLDPEEG